MVWASGIVFDRSDSEMLREVASNLVMLSPKIRNIKKVEGLLYTWVKKAKSKLNNFDCGSRVLYDLTLEAIITDFLLNHDKYCGNSEDVHTYFNKMLIVNDYIIDLKGFLNCIEKGW